MPQTVPPIIDDVADTLFVGFASFTILVWDHIITFADEVEYIWKGSKGPSAFLLLSSQHSCARFIRYEGCTVAIAVEVVGLMMLLRINALYPRQKWITAMLGILLVVETGINAWLISRGEPVLHNKSSGIHACSMIFDPQISTAATASAWYPLLYDSIVFALTVNRTLPSIRKKQAGFVLKRLFEDGLLYYSVIFAITCVLTFMIVAAPPGTKNICAQ
ncbi:hypothetical protein R3P38DRAFT_3307023 [Favolaschia claudopus]|uniref:DUF6533 domain-containing protein n=1 Tax=Favolaschia claudopus TaxID=2862362 RepID=A0AAW0D8K5_9AGAR